MSVSTADTSVTQTLKIPDDWSPERQMALMLGLCEAQMESALGESDQAVDVLIQAFTTLVDTARAVGSLTESLPAEVKSQLAPGLEGQLALFSRQMGSAIVAFQFYDKLSQRLGHVRYSLSTLAMFACSRAQTQQPEQWARLHSTLRRLYRTEEERAVFQMIMEGDGSGFVDTSRSMAGYPAAKSQVGEIELF